MNLYAYSAALMLLLPVTLARGCKGGSKAREAVNAALVPPHETIQKPLADGIELWADVYRTRESAEASQVGGAPVLLCMHMTSSSRGEYKRLAAEMLALGVHVMSVDLRSGGAGEIIDRRTGVQSGTMNETWKQARELLGHNPNYLEAWPDVHAAVLWAKELFPYSRIALVGSSYTASLALVYAAEHPADVDAVAAFSPGEYIWSWSVAQKVQNLVVPSYITCGNTPADTNQAIPIANAIQDQLRVTKFWPEQHGIVGDHGSRTLLIQGAVHHRRQWDEFENGIRAVFRPIPAVELQQRREALLAR